MQKINKRAVILSFVASYTFLLLPLTPLLAQEPEMFSNSDLTGPLIRQRTNIRSVPSGRRLTVEATITDNVAVKGASLFYRFMGTREYFSRSMDSVGNHLYSVTIPGQYVQEPGLEYYIEASDEAGNTTVFRGFEFSPLAIVVVSESSSGKAWYRRWWVWTIVGGIILSAATVAATAGGGDKAAPPPPTGTAAIDAPIP